MNRVESIGTKCLPEFAKQNLDLKPETIGDIYREIVLEHGQIQLHKPVPGESYRKVYTPLEYIDRNAFRILPANIKIVQPPRLYRSSSWKYKGNIWFDCVLNWEFQCRYEYAGEWLYKWLPVRLLSTCYIPETLVDYKKSIELRTPQLLLF